MQPTEQPDHAGAVARGARRRRPILASLTTLGVVTGLLGVAGVFAAGSDRATTGENDVISGELGLPGEDVDLELASATFDSSSGVLTCGEDWSDDLNTGVVTSGGQVIDGQYAGVDQFDEGYLCVRNVGDGPADLSVRVVDLVDTELDCSNGEAATDETCGAGTGELSSHLVTGMQTGDSACVDIAGGALTVAQLTEDFLRLGVLQPQQVLGLCPFAYWEAAASSQSDQASWRYAFDGALSSGVACADDDAEDNDTLDQASGEMYLGDTYAAVSCSGDEDWFRVGEGSDEVATFRLTHDPSLGDLDLFLYDADGVRLASSEDTTGVETIQIAPVDVYFIQVVQYSGVGAIPYELSLTSGEALTPLP